VVSLSLPRPDIHLYRIVELAAQLATDEVGITAQLQCFHALMEELVIGGILADYEVCGLIVGPIPVDMVNYGTRRQGMP
jgi:hypothetical protein